MTDSLTSPLRHLDPQKVDEAARRETRNREVYLPPISVYRWWARRTEAVNGAILDAVARDHSGRLVVADVFAGGGVIPLAAAVRGHRVYAQDLNPWAAYGLHAMLNLPHAGALTAAAATVEKAMEPLLSRAYETTMSDGYSGVTSHTFRVATADCQGCGQRLRLYPHAMVSLRRRKERGIPDAFLACRGGHLFEGRCDRISACPTCDRKTDPKAVYTARRAVRCVHCRHENRLESLAASGTWGWEVALVERTRGRTRELALPTCQEVAQATNGWTPKRDLGSIPAGREAAVLRRHGFENWHDLYPSRQRHVLEALLEAIESAGLVPDVAEALRTAAFGVAEMAGLASRWDRWYLKSYETMAAHRFNFTTFAAEPNVWGTGVSGRGTFRRRVALFEKAAAWLTGRTGKLNVAMSTAEAQRRRMAAATDVMVVEGSSERLLMPAGSVDLVLTDPPYHDDVQYGELSLPLRAWAGLPTTDLASEAVANDIDAAAYEGYREILARIFTEARRALAPTGHLIFSYANREPEAWVAVLRALHDAGFRAAGYAVVHSENETDHAKRNVRACTMDLILDMIPADAEGVEPWSPSELPVTPEGRFLKLVGDTLIRRVGIEEDGWMDAFRSEASSHTFIAKA